MTVPRTSGNEKPRRVFYRLRRDFERYYPNGSRTSLLRKLQAFLATPGMHASVVFRFGNWIHRSIPNRFVRLPFSILYAIMEKLCIFCWGIWIHPAAEIGPGFYIGHFGGIIVGPVKMGYDCNISQQVTIGMRVDGQPGVPSFGDRVWIGAGSVIYGDIEIGSGVSIAPLTLVSRSLPDRVMVAGNPLRVLAKDYDNSQSIYGCPDEDRKAPASDPCDIPPCASTTGGLDSSAP